MEKKGKTVKITPELIIILKKPLGKFFQGTEDETILLVKDYFKKNYEKSRPPLIICVGDICTRSLLSAGFEIDIAIIDGKTLRTSNENVNFPSENIFKLSNKKGYIEAAAWNLIKNAIDYEKKPVLIQVEGEEDLLTLIAVLESPLNSIVFYGQPPITEFNMDQGLVMVQVTSEKKKEFLGYLEKMMLAN
ncbi:MAG: GTP-dependent dephospho-CoA kinase family protein [Candidatus Helarchaeota archaeon]